MAGEDSPKALYMDISNLGNESFTLHICTELNRNNKLMQHVLAYTVYWYDTATGNYCSPEMI